MWMWSTCCHTLSPMVVLNLKMRCPNMLNALICANDEIVMTLKEQKVNWQKQK